MKNLPKYLLRLSAHLALAVFSTTLSMAALATNDVEVDQKGLSIMQTLEQRDTGWRAASVDLQMILRNARGDESTRELTVNLLEVENDGDKSFTLFKSPKDIRNTAFLSYSHAVTADDQWIFMPAFNRVKRISSANKSGPFMGSELAYEDISSFELDKYSYRYLQDEVLNSIDCFVVELTPRYEYSGYSTIKYWVDKARYVPLKIEYLDKSESLLKTQTFSDYRQYMTKYWRPESSVVTNHQTQRSTLLKWGEFDFSTDLKESDFSKMNLSRRR